MHIARIQGVGLGFGGLAGFAMQAMKVKIVVRIMIVILIILKGNSVDNSLIVIPVLIQILVVTVRQDFLAAVSCGSGD